MSKAKNTEQAPSFEAAVAELEAIVTRMEDGQLSLEESLAVYRRGVSLLKSCQAQLGDAENQLRIFDQDELKPHALPAERS